MPFIASIVDHINETLKANCALLADGTFYGIASVIARKKTQTAPLEQLPGVLVNHMQYKEVWPNDKYSLIVYHKILSNAYTWVKNDSYGDGYRQKCTTEMQMVVWGDGKKLGIDEELEAVVLYSMPQALGTPLMRTLGFAKCTISAVGSALDRILLFRQEYPQSEFFLKPNHQFFSIRYRVEAEYDKRCIDLCVSRAVLTFASAQQFKVGLQLVQRFKVGAIASPMKVGSTTYNNAMLAGKDVFVMADNLSLPVDDGSGKVDFSAQQGRYVRKLKADKSLTVVGGTIDGENMEVYIQQPLQAGLQLLEQFTVGAPGSPMAAGDTAYINPVIAGQNMFVVASSIGVPVDDGTGNVDYTALGIRYVQKLKASDHLDFIGGGVVDGEIIALYTSH